MTKQYRKQFFPTYLMIKTHQVTGLKYFCKTTKSDAHKYAGSGVYWTAHLKIHGRKWDTEIIGYFTDENECRQAASKFSRDNDIVHAVDESGKKIWANMIEENGTDGGKTYEGPRSNEVRESVSKGIRRYWETASADARERAREWGRINGAKGRKRRAGEWAQSDEAKEKLRVANTGKKHSAETIAKRAESNRKPRSENARENIRRGIDEYWKSISHLSLEEQQTLAAKRSARAKQAKIDHPQTPEIIDKIKAARAKQENVFDLGNYLKGKVVVVDKLGNRMTVSNEQYYSQTGNKEDWQWVSHKSKEAKMRRG